MEPLFELRSFIDEETGEQVAVITIESFFQPIRLQARFECRHVTRDELEIDCNFFVSPRQDCVVAESPPQDVKRFSERCARVLLIGVRPEQTEQRIAAMESARLGDAEVSEEGHSLRLSEQ